VKRILVIEDDDTIRSNILELLEAEGFDGVGMGDGKAGISAALRQVPDVIVCDITMPVMDGHQVLAAIRDYPETAAVPFIFLTARAQRDDVREGMRLGADDYLTKPFTRRELLDSIEARLERQETLAQAFGAPRASAPAVNTKTGPIIVSDALEAVYDSALRAAASNLSVLLLGETGVGKDVLAHALHKASPRASAPFIPLNCAALSESLLESELFGHEKGAFTGAQAAREGLFEAADGGTVFLDEVGDLPLTTQAKLLRVLEERRVLRVGGRSFRDVDVRFVAATNRNLEQEAAAGRFRQDLFFRIAGIALTVPPLRERRADILPLAMRFAENHSRQLGSSAAPEISTEARSKLESYDWPGNVRELRNVVERTITLHGSGEIRVEHLPDNVRDPSDASPRGSAIADLEERMRDLEKQRVVEALEACGGNQTRAAELLGISRRTLLNRLDEFDLPRPRKK
jgi:DNA-binding NtrC family response regulator